MEAGLFDEQIVPVAGIERDEHPRANTTLEALAKLKPAFRKDGTVTAGNAAGINDGAGAVVMMRESEAKARGYRGYLAFRGAAVAAVPPEVMGIGPVPAVKKLTDKLGVSLADVDIIELNEAFAAQALAVIRDAGMDPANVNPNGGAISLGHPIGATGAILAVKLMYELRRAGKALGIVTMCIGGGQGMAALFECR
jgi:acetyl-CoA C-acetyltransferase